MQTFDQSLLKLYKDGRVSMEEALANADSRANLEAQIHFA
jgi:twitching motility protein PilU